MSNVPVLPTQGIHDPTAVARFLDALDALRLQESLPLTRLRYRQLVEKIAAPDIDALQARESAILLNPDYHALVVQICASTMLRIKGQESLSLPSRTT